MTQEEILELIWNEENYGKLPSDAALSSCIGAFNYGNVTNIAINRGAPGETFGTTYETIDFSSHLSSAVNQQNSVVVVLLLYPQVSTGVSVQYYDPNVPGEYSTLTYSSRHVSQAGNPVSFSWLVTAGNFNLAAKAKVKFTAANVSLKYHLIRITYKTWIPDVEEQ